MCSPTPPPPAADWTATTPLAYDEHGPPGQTCEANLGKLARHHHRIKTHAGWSVSQHEGRFTWTTPHGRTYTTDRNGTHRGDLTWAPAA